MTSVLTLIPQTHVYHEHAGMHAYMYCCHFYTLPTCTFSLCTSPIHFSSSYSLSNCSPFLCASVMPLFLSPYQNNVTPLYAASQEGHHDVVQTLLGAGAGVNIARSDVSDV